MMKISWVLLLLVGIMLCISAADAATTQPEYTITYKIDLEPDGSALWNVEYRTLLHNDEEVDAFERDAADDPAIPGNEVMKLMENSAANAAVATGRPMSIKDFSASNAVQSTPTGNYGVILYSFCWTGFAETNDELKVGDVFFGGLYLSKETTLIITIPKDYSVVSTTPPADKSSEEMIWYGLKAFGPGEPSIVLQRSSFPLTGILIGAVAIGSIVLAAWIILRRRKTGNDNDIMPDDVIPEHDWDTGTMEERILMLLNENDGSLYQSEIIGLLGAPKSTVSSALNALNERGLIQKVRKGRENLIRLT